ncbi:hypothetical protein SESBI_01696 [Sesbania bispinosa]|nr:hypothetical protein SESBI_01696 [Sesbania bispinosa]
MRVPEYGALGGVNRCGSETMESNELGWGRFEVHSKSRSKSKRRNCLTSVRIGGLWEKRKGKHL